MFRKPFVEVLTNTGMGTLKSVRPLLQNRDPNDITEFQLLTFENFDEKKFASMVGYKYEISFIDLSQAIVTKDTLNLLQKKYVIKYRVIPVQKTKDNLVLATYDPTVKVYAKELAEVLNKPVEIILTTISSWKKIVRLC